MNDILDVIFTTRFFAATLIYSLLTLLISWLDLWLEDKLHDIPVSDWLAEHFGIPLLHVLAMIVFIILLYPVLFAIDPLPSIVQLISNGEGRIQHMMNWVFVIALLIPMIPLIGPRVEIILPVQGLVVLVILSRWLVQFLDYDQISLIPHGATLGAMLMTGLAGSYLTVVITQHLGRWSDEKFNVQHSGTLLYPILALVIQTPTLALYARGIFQG
jgi:hypothetical protein